MIEDVIAEIEGALVEAKIERRILVGRGAEIERRSKEIIYRLIEALTEANDLKEIL